jgi:hypothetical protein
MKKGFVKGVALTAALSLATVNFAFAGGSIGHGDISVFKNGVLANKLSGQNPIEDGSLLACDGKCMLKSQGISIVAEDKSQIAVANEADTFKLYVKEGSVDYVINNNTRKIAFYTPQGTYTVAEVVFNASGPSVVKGKVEVSEDGSTEISVTEGRLVFTTAEGVKNVDANHKIILALADIPTTVAPFEAALPAVALVLPLAANLSNDGAGFTIESDEVKRPGSYD